MCAFSGVLLAAQALAFGVLGVLVHMGTTEYFAVAVVSILALNVVWLLLRVHRNTGYILRLARQGRFADIQTLSTLNQCMLAWTVNNFLFLVFWFVVMYRTGSSGLVFCVSLLVSSIVDFVATWRIYAGR